MKLNYKRVLYVFLAAYFLIGVTGLGDFNFIWDETQNTAPAIFMYDFAGTYMSSPMTFSRIKDYAINYHAHYQFALNFLHHPPLQRLMVLFSYFVLGISEFASRIPTLLFGVLGIYVTFLLAEALTRDKKVAFFSSVIMGLSTYYFIYSRTAMIEVFLTTFVTASVLFFYRFLGSRKRSDGLLFGLFLGLGMLTKVYAVLVLPIVFVYILLTKKHAVLKSKDFILSVALALVLAAPWYIASFFVLPSTLGIPSVALKAYESYISLGFVDPLVVLSYFFKQFLVISIIAILGVAYAVRRKNSVDKFLLAWIAVFYIFFIFFVSPSSGHLARFVMPTIPAFAILSAMFLDDALGFGRKTYMILGVSVVVACIYLLSYYPNLSYSMDEATTWALENTPAGGGVISPDYGQQFYFMEHDRNMSVYFFMTAPMGDPFYKLLYENYTDSMNQALGIRNPEFYYVIIKDPTNKTLVDYLFNFENVPSYESREYKYLENTSVFTLVKSIYRDEKYKINIYKIIQ
jgi:hypothetical protein